MNNNSKQNKSNKTSKTLMYLWLFIGSFLLVAWTALSYMWFFNPNSSTDLSERIIDSNYNYSETAYFAGGCFWCMEEIFEKQDGVEGAYSGYTGWEESTATYEQTSTKTTNHREAVRVVYDPDVISFRKLVELYWTQTDPTDGEGQFVDRWFVYSPAIYYSNEQEKLIAQQSKNDLNVSGRFDLPIATVITPATQFYDAEPRHQNYYKEKPVRYRVYTSWSGRKEFIAENWQDRIDELQGKDYINGMLVSTEWKVLIESKYTESELREMLTPLQYKVVVEQGTEPAFDNKYWDNKEPWIYVDIIDGTPLYSSLDKFDSGTGWPSFTKSLDDKNITIDIDTRYFMTRTKVDSATSGAHLWHIFEDAPQELWGIRHCINSASLRFVPVEDLMEEGYWEYIEIFE